MTNINLNPGSTIHTVSTCKGISPSRLPNYLIPVSETHLFKQLKAPQT